MWAEGFATRAEITKCELVYGIGDGQDKTTSLWDWCVQECSFIGGKYIDIMMAI